MFLNVSPCEVLRVVFPQLNNLSFVVSHTCLLCFLPARYKIIHKEKVTAAGDDKKRCTDLLTKYDKTKKEWQLGKTKVRCGRLK